MALEDTWPSHWLTVAQADTAGAAVNTHRAAAPWAERYFQSLVDEAELLLRQAPQVPVERVGWRHDYYSPDTAAPLVYDPASPDAHLDPSNGRFYSGAALRRAWVLLTHERSFKRMRSMGLLYAATGDERYAAWVAGGMRAAADFVETAEAGGWERRSFGGTAVWYQPLYEATALLALANAYALTRESGAYDAPAHDRIRKSIFEARIPRQMNFLQSIGGLHNMAAYAAAAVAVAGELYEREDWLAFGVGPDYGFVRWLEANVPDGADGQPDGWWNEQSTFYHFYALAPMITLYNLSGETLSEANAARFRGMFEAPLQLVQPDLNFHLMGDLAAPGSFSIVDVRSFYEFAAGVLSPERFGPVLARIYAQADLERGCLWALLYGPAELPRPGPFHRGHGRLPVSGFGTFRDPAGELEVGFRGGPFRGGHDHPDRLSVFLADAGGGIAADLGEPGYGLRRQTEDYFRRTISHNTLFADEKDNLGSAEVDWRLDAAPARAKGVIADADGVRYERTVYFDPPFVVVVDQYRASTERRFGWAFHARGDLELLSHQADASTAAQPPLGMPPIPASGNGYKLLTGRRAAGVNGSLRARWQLGEARHLEAVVAADGPFEATTARSAGNPFPADRGALLLRAPGTERRFFTVFERHSGESRIERLEMPGEDRIRLRLRDGSERVYA